MAEIVIGAATSHSPMLSLPGDKWHELSKADRNNQDLVFPPEGWLKTYDDGVAVFGERHHPTIVEFEAQSERCQTALDTLADTLRSADVDVALIVTDDQEEWFFEDNMPTFAVYWGESVPIVPRQLNTAMDPEAARLVRDGYGDVSMDVPVASGLGRHVVEHLMSQDFDPAHFTVLPQQRGGEVTARYATADGETSRRKVTPARQMGLPHGASFVVKRLFHNNPPPILPVFLNTCYPPNVPSPARAHQFGAALSSAVQAWPTDARVAVIASGGLSHFVVDEDLDLALLGGLEANDDDVLRRLPPQRMQSGSSEILNWIAVGGVMASVPLVFQTVDYLPVYRTPLGTGGGWGFGLWQQEGASPSRALDRSAVWSALERVVGRHV